MYQKFGTRKGTQKGARYLTFWTGQSSEEAKSKRSPKSFQGLDVKLGTRKGTQNGVRYLKFGTGEYPISSEKAKGVPKFWTNQSSEVAEGAQKSFQ